MWRKSLNPATFILPEDLRQTWQHAVFDMCVLILQEETPNKVTKSSKLRIRSNAISIASVESMKLEEKYHSPL